MYPEEWVASSVKAIQKNAASEHEGISKICGQELYFDELLRTHRQEMLGDRTELGVLVKILDSAIRLPAQAHPDPAFSRKYFHSGHGKTESWVILDTRPGAAIYFGFLPGITRAEFERAIEDSVSDRRAMERVMCRIPVQKGDVFLVPPKTIHAIGAGCLLLEVQEPTDFTIQPEHLCGDYHLDDFEMYLGLPKEQALTCFDFGPQPAAKRAPVLLSESPSVSCEQLIGPGDTPCFTVLRTRVTDGSFPLTGAPAVYVVTEGAGLLICDELRRPLQKGDYFFLPYALSGKAAVEATSIELIECIPGAEPAAKNGGAAKP